MDQCLCDCCIWDQVPHTHQIKITVSMSYNQATKLRC